jgi:hypothetical protein
MRTIPASSGAGRMPRLMAEKYGRLVAYLPLVGTALILIAQDFLKGFLPAFTLGPAVAALAVSIILLIWYFERALKKEEQALDHLSQVVSGLAAGQQKLCEQVAPDLRRVSLGEAFQIASAVVPRVKQLRVYAVTSQQIISFLEHSGISAERCSLLIREPVAGLPLLNSQLEATILNWKALADQGLIGSLEIRRYDFQPLEYEVIFDSFFMINGLYHPCTAESYGVRVRTPLAIQAQSASGTTMISEHIARFDCLFESCSAGTAGRKSARTAPAARRVRASPGPTAGQRTAAP